MKTHHLMNTLVISIVLSIFASHAKADQTIGIVVAKIQYTSLASLPNGLPQLYQVQLIEARTGITHFIYSDPNSGALSTGAMLAELYHAAPAGLSQVTLVCKVAPKPNNNFVSYTVGNASSNCYIYSLSHTY